MQEIRILDQTVILSGALNHWPARNDRPWKSPSYLLSKTIGGRRLVPIELGRSYVDEGWGQKDYFFQRVYGTLYPGPGIVSPCHRIPGTA